VAAVAAVFLGTSALCVASCGAVTGVDLGLLEGQGYDASGHEGTSLQGSVHDAGMAGLSAEAGDGATNKVEDATVPEASVPEAAPPEATAPDVGPDIAPGAVVTAVAVGDNHICALTSAGAVLCWGENPDGELGNGTTTASAVPVPVSGLSSGVTAIAAGAHHTCALTTDGGLVCWGLNSIGQLGNGSGGDIGMLQSSEGGPGDSGLIPGPVSNPDSGVAAIRAAGDMSCALLTNGKVQCWGNLLPIYSFVPVTVPGLAAGVDAIATGEVHACALSPTEGVQCWGSNALGQLGQALPDADSGEATFSVPAVSVPGLSSGITAIAAGGAQTCALTTAGVVTCWGRNDDETNAPDSFSVETTSPTAVSGLPADVTGLAIGPYSACAVTAAGAVLCWGHNFAGLLGDDSEVAGSLTAVPVSGLSSGAATVSVGAYNTCAVMTSGTLECWGGGTSDDNDQVLLAAPAPVAVP